MVRAKQLDAEPGLQLGNGLGHRGLADAELPRRSGERPGIHHAEQRLHRRKLIHLCHFGIDHMANGSLLAL